MLNLVNFLKTISKLKLQHFNSNPFEFKRSWTVEVTETLETDENTRFREFSNSECESYYAKMFEERMSEMESRMEQKFLSCFEQQFLKKNKGNVKGKKIQAPQPSCSQAAAQRMTSYLNDIRSSSTSTSSRFTEDEDAPLRPRRNQTRTRTTTTTKTVYIKKLDCQINNTPIDQGTCVLK